MDVLLSLDQYLHLLSNYEHPFYLLTFTEFRIWFYVRKVLTIFLFFLLILFFPVTMLLFVIFPIYV